MTTTTAVLHPHARVYVSYGHTDPSNGKMPRTLYQTPGGYVRRTDRIYHWAVMSWFPSFSHYFPECVSLHEGKLAAEKRAARARLNDPRCKAGRMVIAVVEIELKPLPGPRS
jgi:hypothetical protein